MGERNDRRGAGRCTGRPPRDGSRRVNRPRAFGDMATMPRDRRAIIPGGYSASVKSGYSSYEKKLASTKRVPNQLLQPE
jgi:hypothetical protein